MAPKNGKNRFHLELAADGDLGAEVERIVALGATRTDVGEGDLNRLMLADPDGNEFCLLNPR